MVPLRIMLAYEHSVLNETFKAAHPNLPSMVNVRYCLPDRDCVQGVAS
jgi:hypothetical protein